jgi:hypothetical protein
MKTNELLFLPKHGGQYLKSFHDLPDGGTLAEAKLYCEGKKDWVIISRTWFLDGLQHRIGKPAKISYNTNGKITSKTWCLNGVRHRVDGPAVVIFDEEGKHILLQAWFQNGIRNRFGGPALIAKDGKEVTDLKWFINGAEFDRKTDVIIEMSGKPNVKLTRQIVLDIAMNKDREYGRFLLDKLHENDRL